MQQTPDTIGSHQTAISGHPRGALPFDNRMAFDLALEVDDVEDVLARYGVTAEQFARLSRSDAFRKTYQQYRRDIRERGTSFRVKARIQAEALLDTTWETIHDPATPRSVALDAIKSMVRWADLEPDKRPAETNDSSAQFNIQINLGDQ